MLFPGSASIRTAKFAEDVIRVVVLLFTGMELPRGAHRDICARASIPAFQVRGRLFGQFRII